jgi:multiple sugar transport system permease protein
VSGPATGADVLSTGPRRLRLPELSMRGQERTHAYVFLLPTLLVLALVVAFPLVYSVILMFTGAPPAPGQFGRWVGIDNWRQVFSDSVFGQSFRQTLMYLGPSIVAAPVLGLAVALVLNHEFPGRKLVRAALLLPWAIPPVVVAAMFEWFLDPNRGLLGYWLTKIGVTQSPPLFFSGIPQTLFVLVGIHVWKTFPLLAIMFLVALQYLPDEQLQAARIDGAGFWHRLRYIILPHLRPTIIAALVVQFLVTITLFDIIFALTGGGPGQYSTYNLYFYAFKQSFEYNNFNLGSVIAYVVSGLVVSFALILTRGRARMSLA